MAIFLSKAKTKIIKKNNPPNHILVEKSGSNDKRGYNNSYFLEKSSLFDVKIVSQTFQVEIPDSRDTSNRGDSDDSSDSSYSYYKINTSDSSETIMRSFNTCFYTKKNLIR